MTDCEDPIFTPGGVAVEGTVVRLGLEPWPSLKHRTKLGFDASSGRFVFGRSVPDMEPTFQLHGHELPQRMFVFPDPFGRHMTKIASQRASRPQPTATLGHVIQGVERQRQILSMAREYVEEIETRAGVEHAAHPDGPSRVEIARKLYERHRDEGLQLRILVASLTNYEEILRIAVADPSREVRQAGFSNPYAGINYQMFGGPAEGFFLSDPTHWGPQVSASDLEPDGSVGITINPYGCDASRHMVLVARHRKQELRELDQAFFHDAFRLAARYVNRLRSGAGEPLWIDHDADGRIVAPRIDWANLRPEQIDGLQLGMNFGLGRLMEVDGATSTLKTTAWASQIQAHMQCSIVLADQPYPQYEAIHETCLLHPGFMPALAEAYARSSLRIWDDENVVLYASRAPRSIGEMGILARCARSLLTADDATLVSISRALVHAARILEANKQFTFNLVTFGERLSDDADLRLLVEIIPRGGLAYSELSDQWVVDMYPEDYVKTSGERLRGTIESGFGRRSG